MEKFRIFEVKFRLMVCRVIISLRPITLHIRFMCILIGFFFVCHSSLLHIKFACSGEISAASAKAEELFSFGKVGKKSFFVPYQLRMV